MDWSAWLKVGEVILGDAVGGTPAVSSEKQVSIRGLNRNHNHDLKNLFKSAATIAATKAGPFQEFYDALVAKRIKPEMARLTLMRKIAAITSVVWKKGVRFGTMWPVPSTNLIFAVCMRAL
jgi:hypothetical protein